MYKNRELLNPELIKLVDQFKSNEIIQNAKKPQKRKMAN
jgi:hypothetical protein